jgi:hypothetical protein
MGLWLAMLMENKTVPLEGELVSLVGSPRENSPSTGTRLNSFEARQVSHVAHCLTGFANLKGHE